MIRWLLCVPESGAGGLLGVHRRRQHPSGVRDRRRRRGPLLDVLLRHALQPGLRQVPHKGQWPRRWLQPSRPHCRRRFGHYLCHSHLQHTGLLAPQLHRLHSSHPRPSLHHHCRLILLCLLTKYWLKINNLTWMLLITYYSNIETNTHIHFSNIEFVAPIFECEASTTAEKHHTSKPDTHTMPFGFGSICFIKKNKERKRRVHY